MIPHDNQLILWGVAIIHMTLQMGLAANWAIATAAISAQ